MKARTRLWILLSAVLMALAGAGAGIAAASSHEERERPPARDPASLGYVLTDHEGSIGVFRDGVLIMRTDVRLDSLREVDRQLLEAGIEVDSYEALMRLLQDFDE